MNKSLIAAAVLLSLNFQCSESYANIETAILCTALNVFHEARGESIKGQMAVALVTRNRAKYDTEKVCAVVFKSKQFSWTIKMNGIKDSREFEKAIHISALAWQSVDFTQGSTHYHAAYIKPYWTHSMVKTMQIDNHIFYRGKL